MEKLQKFWDIVVHVWQEGYMGIDFGRIFTAIAIFLLFLVFRRVFSRVVLRYISRLSRRTKTEADDRLLRAVKNPVRFIPVLLGLFFAEEYLNLTGDMQAFADNVVRSLVIFVLFWTIFRAADQFSYMLFRLDKVLQNSALVGWIGKTVKIIVAVLGVATILELWGISVASLIAGLGLFGVAVALGAQDMFKNLIAGILIIAERRFNVGDWVKVDGVVEGTVENIGFRSTFIRQFDKAPVYVPNTKLADNAVTNFSAMTHRRIYWKIGVEYDSSVDQLRQVRDGIEKLIIGNPDFAQPEEVSTFVRIDSFNASSIDILLYCFTRTTNWGEWLSIKEKLALDIKDVVEGAGTHFAFPSQSIYVHSLPGHMDGPEVFNPPQEQKSTG
ncbi:mechanosensitive ion channel family protein [Aestuariispira ectoiniformans]|uniref:mechanosensitive ion channel family protein n=1 Tax=Aestuariispira ectoiniformans TaxID=2775080 RepID=UPI00223B97E4|nr:mechanosensitive ion channel family protein [Aestuariispira ectoiniformans]